MRFSSYLFPLGYTSFIDKTKEFPVYVMEYSHSGLQDVCVCIVVFFLFDKVISYVKTGFCCEIVRFKLLIFFGLWPGNRCAHTILTAFVRDLCCKKNHWFKYCVLFFKVFNQSGTLFQIQLIYTIIIYMYNRAVISV